MSRPARRRLVLLLVTGLALGALSACATTPPAPPGAPPTDLRARLVHGLRDENPTTAALVADPATTLEPVPTPWLPGWQVVDAQNGTLAHPRRVYAAVADDGRAVQLTGEPEAFRQMVTSSPTDVRDADAAVAVAETYLDVTRDFRQYAYRVESFDAIEFVPGLSETQRRARDDLERRFGRVIEAPVARPATNGWTTTVWTVTGRNLLEHTLRVGFDGKVDDQATTRATGIPVPESV